MTPIHWGPRLLAILGIAVLAAAGAAALPDHSYQRWQLIENTLYANATWSYERIHYDPQPIDVAILGSSRSQLGLSAPRIADRLAAAGRPAAVANLSVIEDGRNIEWAIADELFKAKRPKLLVVMVSETFNRWGHPAFKYVAPAAAVAWPPVLFLHNSAGDLAYLPYRQMMLFAASVAPQLFDLRNDFDAVRYASKPTDFSVSRTLADGKRIDMDRAVPADDLRAEARAFAATRHASALPHSLAALSDRDNVTYIRQIVDLAARRGTRVMFVFLPEFAGATTIEGRSFYAQRGRIEDYGDLARDPSLFQSFAHLNHRGAMIASDRLAAAIMDVMGTPGTAGDKVLTGASGEQTVAQSSDGGAISITADS